MSISTSKYLCAFYTDFYIIYKNSVYAENIFIEHIPWPPMEAGYC